MSLQSKNQTGNVNFDLLNEDLINGFPVVMLDAVNGSLIYAMTVLNSATWCQQRGRTTHVQREYGLHLFNTDMQHTYDHHHRLYISDSQSAIEGPKTPTRNLGALQVWLNITKSPQHTRGTTSTNPSFWQGLDCGQKGRLSHPRVLESSNKRQHLPLLYLEQ